MGDAVVALQCLVHFTAPLSLDAVAALVSERLFGGAPFAPTEAFDEDPGVALSGGLLSHWVAICGGGPDFGLVIEPDGSVLAPGPLPRSDYLDISSVVEQALARVEGFEVVRSPSPSAAGARPNRPAD